MYTPSSAFISIELRELPVWIRVFRKQGITDKETMLAELNLIDDLLTLQKSQSLLTRKRGLKTMLEARIGKELGHKVPNLNTIGK